MDDSKKSSSLTRLLSQTAIYGLSSIIGRFLNYLLVLLYTHVIAAASGGYGVVTNMYAYTALLLVILTFGMETTFFRFANKDGVNPDKAFSTASLSVGFVSLIFAILCIVFITPISTLMGYADHPEYIGIMAVVVALDAFQAILFSRLRQQNRAIKFAVLKLSFIFFNILLNLFVCLGATKLKMTMPNLMAWFDPNYIVGYIFIVNLLCTASVTFGFIPEMKALRLGIDFSLLKQMLKYTWPLLLLGICGILNQVADKIIYRYLVPGQEGEVQLGIYGACVKITQAFRYAYEPFVFNENKDKNSKENQAKVMKYFIMFTLFAFLAVMFYLDLLKYIIKSDYWEGLSVVPIVMMAEIFMGIYFNLSFWYKLTDRTGWGAIMSGIGCAVLLAINIIFVPKFGYMACAWGGVAGYGVCMLLSYFLCQKYYKVQYDVIGIAGYFALALGLYFLSALFEIGNTWLSLAVNTLLLLVYIGVIAYKERRMLKSVLSAVSKKVLKR